MKISITLPKDYYLKTNALEIFIALKSGFIKIERLCFVGAIYFGDVLQNFNLNNLFKSLN